jgi:S-adenosylmethionine:tRNA ribosyltransferase-isomerase
MHPKYLKINDFTYPLPDERIARYPLPERDASKLLIYNNGSISEDIYRNIATHLPSGTTLVFNQTKVIHARLQFYKSTGGAIEVFCLAPHSCYPDMQSAMLQKGSVQWECLVGGAAKWKAGMAISLSCSQFTLSATVIERLPNSHLIQLQWTDPTLTFAEVLHIAGKTPLPPYLRRESDTDDEVRYQTIFAKDNGSVAAPTASLHFTDTIMQSLANKHIYPAFVTLHVGAGTFKPVKTETIEDHDMHAEWLAVSRQTIEQLLAAQHNKIVAVGTTSLRTIESLYWIGAQLLEQSTINWQGIAVTQWRPYTGIPDYTTPQALQACLDYLQANELEQIVTQTQIMIAPGYRLRIASGLITNFHQPQSTLLLLVAALIGDDWRNVYDYAMNHDYRFLSYGDGSLIWANA